MRLLLFAATAPSAIAACARETPSPPPVAETVAAAPRAAAPGAPAPVARGAAPVPLPPDAPRVLPGPVEPLEVLTAKGPVRFQVELADDVAERAQGLMWRASLPADRGMIFDYGQELSFAPETGLGFWMRNTYIPLDIVFIGPDGRIQSIARDTTPLSEAMIFAGAGPVRAILEINGGLSERLGIQPGDRVRHRLLP